MTHLVWLREMDSALEVKKRVFIHIKSVQTAEDASKLLSSSLKTYNFGIQDSFS